jgi:hypothetical protein
MKACKSFLFFLSLLIVPLLAAGAQQKYALVIGNGAYTNITRLNNPVNDANDMTAALQGLGFQVDKVLNGSLDQMENAVIRLKNRLSANTGSYGFFFYAGHGVQSSGENYLIPADANIASESFLRTKALHMQAVLDELNQAGNALNIVVLDACRDNPFSWARSGSRGLQVVGSQPADSIIVYATSAGSTAADGTGRNGLFTEQLLKNIKTPGLSVRDVFDRTGADVARVSGRKQIPAVYSQFFGTVYLAGTAPAATPTVRPAAAPVNPAPPSRTFRIGDRGPGGGIVFFAQGGKYMEVGEKLDGAYKWDDAVTAARNYKGGGYSDWRLPTIDELNLVYQNLRAKNIGNLGNDWYWSSSSSSSEGDNDDAWFQDFGLGYQYRSIKDHTSSVRPVRAF